MDERFKRLSTRGALSPPGERMRKGGHLMSEHTERSEGRERMPRKVAS